MREIAEAVVRAGLVSEDSLNEMARWGIHITAIPNAQILNDHAAVVEHIREAIEGESQIRIDETDLDLLSRYLNPKYQKEGRLILKEGDNHTTLKISFCMTLMGDYAIPWTDEDTPDVIYNGESHLKYKDEIGEHDVYFCDAHELYLGKHKAFAVCVPVREKP